MSDIRYPGVGEIWYNDLMNRFTCFFSDDKGCGFERSDGMRFFLTKENWETNQGLRWAGPKRVSDVLCFYVTPAKTIKATFLGDKNAMGKPYFLELFDDGSLNVREAS